MFNNLVLTDYAKTTHNEIVSYLSNRGFHCEIEFKVPDRGDGRGGRVDVVAIKDDFKIAIEIDRRSPRLKSIYKLKSLPLEFARCVICRKTGNYRKVNDFHFIYPIRVNECPSELVRQWKPKKKKKNYEKKYRLIGVK